MAYPVSVNDAITVINTSLVDIIKPAVTAITINPGTVDTSASAANITLNVSLADDLSGFIEAYLFFYNPADEYSPSQFVALDASNRTDGNNVAGTYQATVVMPQGSATGLWKVRALLRDKTGNSRFYGYETDQYPVPGTGISAVNSPLPPLFTAFMRQSDLTGNNALLNADPDGDGRDNITELLQGTHPSSYNIGGSSLTFLTRDATALHLNITITPALTVTSPGQFLELSNGGGGAPLRVSGQTQPTLAGAWTRVLPGLQSGSTYRVSLPFAGGTKTFARFAFENP